MVGGLSIVTLGALVEGLDPVLGDGIVTTFPCPRVILTRVSVADLNTY